MVVATREVSGCQPAPAWLRATSTKVSHLRAPAWLFEICSPGITAGAECPRPGGGGLLKTLCKERMGPLAGAVPAPLVNNHRALRKGWVCSWA